MKFGMIMLIIVSIFIVGCSQTKTIDDQIDMSSVAIYRTIQLNGEELRVTLHAVIPPGARYYFFEEKLPANAELISSDIALSNRSIKEVFFSDVKSANFTYVIKANRGTYVFSGSYVIDGDMSDSPIRGANRVVI